jgi:hypothetical protein
MKSSYDDIISRITEPPRWFDENGVPRYCEFAPELSNIYAFECALLEIACQGCDKRFSVAVSLDNDAYLRSQTLLIREVVERTIEYGDPPNTECCSGTTMMSEVIRVLEFWRKESGNWARCPAVEVLLKDMGEIE